MLTLYLWHAVYRSALLTLRVSRVDDTLRAQTQRDPLRIRRAACARSRRQQLQYRNTRSTATVFSSRNYSYRTSNHTIQIITTVPIALPYLVGSIDLLEHFPSLGVLIRMVLGGQLEVRTADGRRLAPRSVRTVN